MLPFTYFYDKIFPICITVSATALLFILDKIIGYQLKKKEFRRSWYLDIIIKPNLINIDGFFNGTLDLFIEFNQYADLISITTVGDHVNKKNELLNKFRDLKSNLNSNLIFLLKDNHKDIYIEVNNLLMSIEDNFSSSIDKMTQDENFSIVISGNKRDFLTLLYQFLD